MTYATKSDIEAMVGYTISDSSDSLPTETYLDVMLERADSIINAEMKETTNITDTYGYLKTVACNLVYKMINNVLAIQSPEKFGPMEVTLTPEDMRLIHMAHEKWATYTTDIGE